MRATVKMLESRTDARGMEPHPCPYDDTAMEAVDCRAGALFLSCATCGAQWLVRNSLVVRTIEPDWDAVEAHVSEAEGRWYSTPPGRGGDCD